MSIFPLPPLTSVEGAYVWLQMFSLIFLIGTIVTGAGTIITGYISNQRQAKLIIGLASDLEAERIRRLSLEKAVSRRELLDDINLDKLKALRGVPAVVQFLPNDQETRRAAGNLYAILQSSGWDMKQYAPNPDLWLPEWDGVVVEAFEPSPTDFRKRSDQEQAEIDRVQKAAEALVSFLEEHHWQARIGRRSASPLPLNALSIKVGFKSLPQAQPSPKS